jgi:chemotaxis protein methyltransferase CheR
MERLPAEAWHDAAVRVTHAAIAAAVGRLREAEASCRAALALAPGCSEAHMVLGLCRERADDWEAAIAHYDAAIAIDSSFAMPHLHRGLLMSRRAARAEAGPSLQRAAMLLPLEAPERLMLFGGGFRRETLVALCLAALRREGGPC